MMTLLDEDREKMRARGFSDATIDKKRWRSCHPNNVRIEADLLEKYGDNALLDAKVRVIEGGKAVFNPQLMWRNILIPYMDAEHVVIKVRPHLMGFKGDPHRVYRPETSYQRSSMCIIAESEFKADAAEAWGYAAVGIPGISSMSGKNWDYFLGELKTIQTDEFIICFDNEVKDNIAWKNYKADWRKRYDTFIYAYAMCQKILSAGLNCKVATLPAEWMREGKIDMDGALAQQRTSTELKAVFNNALAPKAFLKVAPIPENHRNYINRRIYRFFATTPVEVIGNCFFIKIAKPGKNGEKAEEILKRMMNCSLRIQNIYEEVGTETIGVRRDLVITDEYGIESKPVQMSPSAMSGKNGLLTWLMSQGNYLYYGGEQEMLHIWDYVFANDEGNIVYLMNRCGYIRETRFYLFKNVLIKDHQPVYPDENGIFWVDDVGYKANRLSDDETIPSMVTEGSFDVEKFLTLLGDTVDIRNRGQGKAMFAWILAVMFLEDIEDKYKLFPILFLYGNRGSGKTTIMRWLTSFFGQGEATKSLAASSPVGVSRLLSYYASLPLVVDDWRDDLASKKYVTLFLGVYNRQVGAKGIKEKFGLQQTDIRAALSVMGEEMISDNGLATRCTNFYVPMERRRECLEEVEAIIGNASKFTFDVLTQRYAALKPKVLAKISDAIQFLREKLPQAEQRLIINHGILMGTFNAVMDRNDAELKNYFLGKVTAGQHEISSGDKMHRFAEEFLFGVSENLLSRRHYKFEGTKILLWVKGICDVMNKFYNRTTDSSSILIKHMSQQPYFVGSFRAVLSGHGGLVPSVKLDLEKMTIAMRESYEGAMMGDTFDYGNEQGE